ncbi:MAG: CBS domain-containing protein [Halobacteriota archaeon]
MFDEAVIEISTRKVTTVSPDTSIAKAIGVMEKNSFHNLVVLDGGVIYMVNIHDLLLASNPESHVDAFMFTPHCIHRDTQTIDAISELVNSGQRGAPVVADDGKLEGIVTVYDIMKRGADSLILKDTNAAKIMTREPVCIGKTESIENVRSLIRKDNVGHVLVVDNTDKLAGIVTEGDILKRFYKPKRRMTAGEFTGEKNTRMEQPVEHIMSSPVITVGADANLAEIARLMWNHDIRAVPIVEDQSPDGLVTIQDIMRYLSELREKAKIEVEIQGTIDDEYKELADEIIDNEVRKIARSAKRVHWVKIVIKKERDRGGVSYYKIGVHVKTPNTLYVGHGEPGGTKTLMTSRGVKEVEVKADKRHWDFIDVLKSALESVRGQVENDRGKIR